MNLVVKIGGALLESAELRQRWARAMAALAAQGHRVAAVHGGGSSLTRTLQQLGKQSQFINGLRVTDAETRDTALMVLAGLVNKQLVAALAEAGQAAVGLCGGDGLTFRARRRTGEVDLGYVGEISASNPALLHAIWQQQAVPVIASIALGEDGQYYNVNADSMAAACAVATGAALLAFVTDVPGVWDSAGQVIQRLTIGEVDGLKASGAVKGGMLPKLEACSRALSGGVGRVHIMPGAIMEALEQLGRGPISVGTELIA